MIELSLYDGTVVDTNDPDRQGKIKIRVTPHFKDIDEALLPWCLPYSSINSSEQLSLDLPSIGSTIRVLIDITFQRFYYLQNEFFSSLFDYSKVTSLLQKAKEITDTVYGHIVFRLYEDGSLGFHNNKNGEHGYIKSDGSYFIFDALGGITLNGGSNKITIIGSQVEIEGGTLTVNGIGGLPNTTGAFLSATAQYDSFTGKLNSTNQIILQ